MLRPRKKLKSKYPSIPVEELPSMVAHYFGIEASNTIFQKPTPHFVQKVFAAVLEVCEGFSKESLTQARMQDLDTLDDPSDIMESIPDLILFDAISTFLENIGMYECRLDSILRPNQREFCSQMDAIMNYMKFRDEKMMVISEQDQRLREAEKEATDMQERWQKSVEEITDLKQKHAAEEAAGVNLEAEYKQIRQDCSARYTRLNQGERSIVEIQTSYGQLKEKVSSSSFELSSRLQELENVKQQIVESPERLEADLLAIAEQVQEQEKIVENLREASMRISSTLLLYEEFKRNVENVQILLSTLNTMNHDNIEKSKNLENLKIEVEELERCLEGKNAEVASLLQKVDKQTDDLEHEEHTGASKLDSLKQQIRKTKNTLDEASARATKIRDTVLADYTTKINHLEVLSTEHESRTQRQIDYYSQRLMEFRDYVVAWRNELGDAKLRASAPAS